MYRNCFLLVLFFCLQITTLSYGILRQVEKKGPEALQYLKTKPYYGAPSTPTVPYREYSRYARRPATSFWGKPTILTPEQQAGLAATYAGQTRGFKTWFKGFFAEPEQNKIYAQLAELTAGASSDAGVKDLVAFIQSTPAEILNKPFDPETASKDLSIIFRQTRQDSFAENMMSFVIRKIKNLYLQYDLTRLFIEKGVENYDQIWVEPIWNAGALKALLDTGKITEKNHKKVSSVYPEIKFELEKIKARDFRNIYRTRLQALELDEGLIESLVKKLERYPEGSKEREKTLSTLSDVQARYKQKSNKQELKELRENSEHDEQLESYLPGLEQGFKKILSSAPGLKGLAY